MIKKITKRKIKPPTILTYTLLENAANQCGFSLIQKEKKGGTGNDGQNPDMVRPFNDRLWCGPMVSHSAG